MIHWIREDTSGEASRRRVTHFSLLLFGLEGSKLDTMEEAGSSCGSANTGVPDAEVEDPGEGPSDNNERAELVAGALDEASKLTLEEKSLPAACCSRNTEGAEGCSPNCAMDGEVPECEIEEVKLDVNHCDPTSDLIDEADPEMEPARNGSDAGLDDNGNPVAGPSLQVPQAEDSPALPSSASHEHSPEYYHSLGAKPKHSDYLTDLNRKRKWLYEALIDYPAAPEKLHQLLKSGVSANMEFTEDCLGVNHKIFAGYSPIHYACTEGSTEMLEDLIQYKADVNKIGKNGESALYYACVGCKLGHARVLLRHNAEINLTDADIGGETPLLATVAAYSAEHCKADEYLEIARMLILAGAGVNQSDYMDVSPLYVAVTKKDTRMTQLLINSGATLLVSGNNEYATKLLMRAIDHESEANVRLLISYGCDVNGVSQSHGLRHTPLDLAVVKNNLGIILDLLNAGAGEDLNEPLHSAARNKHLVTLLLLIAQGGDVNARNNVDKATLMLTLTRARSVVGVDMLMRLAANPNYENTLGTTPLWAAVRANYPELVKRFIFCNCYLDTPSIQHFLYRPITALQLALELKFFDMAQWLLYAGCMMKSRWLQDNQLPIGLRDEPRMLAWLEKWTQTPRSLRFLCRTVVRQKTGLGLPVMLKSILYPDSLKDFIRLADLERETEIL